MNKWIAALSLSLAASCASLQGGSEAYLVAEATGAG